MHQVFLSHSTKDDSFVTQLRAELELRSIGVWVDSRQLIGGDALEPAVQKAIEEATHFLAVLSPRAVNAAWVTKEIRYALEVQKRRQGFRVIPLLLDGIEAGALGLWFGEVPIAIRIEIGPGGLQAALPELFAAFDLGLPTDPEPTLEPPAEPLPDLILTFSDPRFEGAAAERRARATVAVTYQPPDGSPAVHGLRRYDFTAPLGSAEQAEIAWYLDRYPRWPNGVFRERAKRLEAQLPELGRQLYRSALDSSAGQGAVSGWQAASGTSRRLTLEVDSSLPEGSAKERVAEAGEAATQLLGLPWELLHDGQAYLFQGAHGVRVRRRLPNYVPRAPLLTRPPLRVLLASPRPEDSAAAYFDHRSSAQPLVEAVSALGDLAHVTLLTPATFPAFAAELRRASEAREPYHVVHFDGHGVFDPHHGLGALCFEDPEDVALLDRRRSQVVDADQIAQVLRDHRVPLVFLDACQSAKAGLDPTASVAGKLMEGGVASVAAMSHSVLVETARRFTAGFYRELVGGHRVGDSMLAGQRDLQENSFRLRTIAGDLRLADWFVPVLFQEDNDPQLVTAMPAAKVRAAIAERRGLALGALPAIPAHSFVGRSRELLRAERLLERAPYVVLRGEGGEGKTAIACELVRWLVASGRFGRGAFVSLERDGSSRGVLFAFGRQLVPNYLSQAGADPEAAVQLVERALADEPTLLLLDNVESVLPAPGQAPTGDEQQALGEILDLCGRLNRAGATRLLFTSREELPAPYGNHEIRIGRLDRGDAITLVGRALAAEGLVPGASGGSESETDVDELVEAAGCHARSLVLLAREVAASGVRRASSDFNELMKALEARYPGDRERSLLASVELSLRRLPAATRERLRPLAVFQGGGHLGVIAAVLGLDTAKDEEVDLSRQLIAVGLAEPLASGYLRFDPALCTALRAEIGAAELTTAQEAWAKAEISLASALNGLAHSDPELAWAICLLDLPNLLAALEHVEKGRDAQKTVFAAGLIAPLLQVIGRPKAQARVAGLMNRAATNLHTWSPARFIAASQTVADLSESGRYTEALAAARDLVGRAESAGGGAYDSAPYDLALSHYWLGRVLTAGGAAEEGLSSLSEALRRSTAVAESGEPGAERLTSACLTKIADALSHLNRLEEAAEAYEKGIALDEARQDPRDVAVGKVQLGTVRLKQKKYSEALQAYVEARQTFERLGEPASVARQWSQIGVVYQQVGEYESAEKALQEALSIRVQIQDRSGENITLVNLGRLYSSMDRPDDALSFYRQAAQGSAELRNLFLEHHTRRDATFLLLRLKRFDEARSEVMRAIECCASLGNEAEPWRTLDALRQLEQAVGQPVAAAAPRAQAIQLYLAYRREGGSSSTGGISAALCTRVAAALADGSIATLKSDFTEMLQRPDLPPYVHALIPALEEVLAGSRDPALAGLHNLDYDDEAEVLLLLEVLALRERPELKA